MATKTKDSASDELDNDELREIAHKAELAARSVEGLSEEDYEDARGHALETILGRAPTNRIAYAKAVARNHALSIAERAKSSYQPPTLH